MKNLGFKSEKAKKTFALLVVLYVVSMVMFSNTYYFISNLKSGEENIVQTEKYPNEVNPTKKASSGGVINFLGYINYFFGLQTTFSFFSPRVSNDCFFTTKIYSNGKIEKIAPEHVIFNTREGLFRWECMTHMYIDKEKSYNSKKYNLDSIRSQFLHLQKERFEKYFQRSNSIDSSETTLYFYLYPSLNEFPNNTAFIKELK